QLAEDFVLLRFDLLHDVRNLLELRVAESVVDDLSDKSRNEVRDYCIQTRLQLVGRVHGIQLVQQTVEREIRLRNFDEIANFCMGVVVNERKRFVHQAFDGGQRRIAAENGTEWISARQLSA